MLFCNGHAMFIIVNNSAQAVMILQSMLIGAFGMLFIKRCSKTLFAYK